jgi:hypothetical protein
VLQAQVRVPEPVRVQPVRTLVQAQVLLQRARVPVLLQLEQPRVRV